MFRLMIIRLSLTALVSSTIASSPAAAEDCNDLIENNVAYLQAPKAPNECSGTYHVISSVVTITNVTTIQTASPEAGQPPISTDVPLATVAVPGAPDQLLQIQMAKRTRAQILAGVPPFPVRPYVLKNTSGIARYYSDSFPAFSKSDTMSVELREGAPGQPATMVIEFAPLNVATSNTTLRRLSANATCIGSFLSGFFGDQTAITIALSKTRSGSCGA